MLRVAAALMLVAGSTAIAASAPVQPEAVPLDLLLRQAQRDAAAAEAEQLRLEQSATGARDEVARLRAQQLAAAQAIAAAEARISAADTRARLIQAHLTAQRRRLAAAQAPASALLAGLALTARRPPLLLMADAGSAGDLVKLRLLVAATTPVIEARTAALARQLQTGRRLEQAAIDARTAMARSRDALALRRDAFAKLEARAIRLAQTRGAEALGAGDVAIARTEQLSQLEREALASGEAVRLAKEVAAHGPAMLPKGAAPGRPPLDYRLPADSAVVDGLGAISAEGVRSRGITLATRRGTRLVAPASGTILFAGPFRDYDGVLIIDHGRGWKSVLVNAGSSLRRGDKVAIGEPLGIALGRLEVQLQHQGKGVSPALIAGSSAMLSNSANSG